MIDIPTALDIRLTDKSDKTLVNAAQSACERLVRGGMFFFPEYTDHSQEHISGVLSSCAELIAGIAWPLLTSRDIAALICAVFLHDCGMYLREDQFFWILDNESAWPVLPGYDDESWRALYRKFETEASRFDGRRRLALFGVSDANPALPQKPGNQTDNQRLLVGEFLRRHHPRLAHEFAVHGLPVLDGKPAPFLTLTDSGGDKLADVIGLIARSHGMSLRGAVDLLYDRFRNKIVQHKVHSPYLMALLRVGDYIQIQAERAPQIERRFRAFDSQTSREEWDKHKSISDLRIRGTQHPETIEVTAEPESAADFVGVRGWLDGIQSEIDASWVVLGEVYGSNKDLAVLGVNGLSVRRIKSETMDDPAWAERQSYVPRAARFESVDARLLSLLVGPLYDYSPEIGVRELLQNAVDAVRERQKIEDDLGRSIPCRSEDAPDVCITFYDKADGNRAYMTFVDQGTGMTEDIVLNYFLKAGASFRQSATWKDKYEDESGHSEVMRSGRFGIGALAVFLLCNEGEAVTVETRHYSAVNGMGIKFTARINDDIVEIRRERCDFIGTKVTVHLSDLARRLFASDYQNRAWDWFGMSDVSIVRRRMPSGKQLSQSLAMPLLSQLNELGWQKSALDELPNVEIYWDPRHGSWSSLEHQMRCYCNGVLIASPRREFELENGKPVYPRTALYSQDKWENEFKVNIYSFGRPNYHFIDRSAELQVNLQRTDFVLSYASVSSLLVDFVRFCIDGVSVKNTFQFFSEGKYEKAISNSHYVTGIMGRDNRRVPIEVGTNNERFFPFLLAKHGLSLVDVGIFDILGLQRIFKVVFLSPKLYTKYWLYVAETAKRLLTDSDGLVVSTLIDEDVYKTEDYFATNVDWRMFTNGIQGAEPFLGCRLLLNYQDDQWEPDMVYVSEVLEADDVVVNSDSYIYSQGHCPASVDTLLQLRDDIVNKFGKSTNFAIVEEFPGNYSGTSLGMTSSFRKRALRLSSIGMFCFRQVAV